MDAQIVKWGNGQGIRIPKSILVRMDMEVGDAVEMSVTRGEIIIRKPFRHRTLEERAIDCGGNLVSYEEETNWGEPVGRAVW